MDKFKLQQIKHDMLISITANGHWVSAIKVGTVNVMEETNKGLFNFIVSFEDASDITTTFWQSWEAPNTFLSGKLKPVQVQKNNYFALVLVTIIIIIIIIIL